MTELNRRVKLGLATKSAATRHGLSGTPTYNSFCNAKARCENPKGRDLPHYLGIKFLFTSVEQLVAEIGLRPEGTSIDRFPNPNGNYEPGDVRWATPTEQNTNQRHWAARPRDPDTGCYLTSKT